MWACTSSFVGLIACLVTETTIKTATRTVKLHFTVVSPISRAIAFACVFSDAHAIVQTGMVAKNRGGIGLCELSPYRQLNAILVAIDHLNGGSTNDECVIDENGETGEKTEDTAHVLFDSAVLNSGFALEDSSDLISRVNRLVSLNLGVDLNEEIETEVFVEKEKEVEKEMEEEEEEEKVDL